MVFALLAVPARDPASAATTALLGGCGRLQAVHTGASIIGFGVLVARVFGYV